MQYKKMFNMNVHFVLWEKETEFLFVVYFY